jgi:hypothetical protein
MLQMLFGIGLFEPKRRRTPKRKGQRMVVIPGGGQLFFGA